MTIKLSKLKTGSDEPDTMQRANEASGPTVEAAATPVEERGLSTFGEGMGANALMQVIEENASRKMLFPILQVAGGNSAAAGTYGPIEKTDADLAARMPVGNKGRPFNGVFLGYRTEILAWALGYNDPKPADDDGRPAWSGVLDPRNAEDAKLVLKASEAYHFTKTIEKSPKFNGVGHPRPSLQILVYVKDVGPIVVQLPGHHFSWTKTLASLSRHTDPATKALGQFPAVFRVDVEDKTINGNPTKTTSLGIDQFVSDEAKALWTEFQTWRDAVKNDPEKAAEIRGWLTGEDHPITDTVRDKLKACAALK